MKTYFTFLSRNKLYSAVTFFGFASALAFVILTALYVKDEFTVERHQPNADRIYRFQCESTAATPLPLAGDLAARYPEIESTTRIGDSQMLVKGDGVDQMRARGMMVDSTFFNIFSYPFVEGSASTALATDLTVAISRSFANEIFPGQKAIGRTMKLNLDEDDKIEVIIGAVFEDFKNSIFEPVDIIHRVDMLPFYRDEVNNYGRCNFSLYVLAKPATDINAKNADLLNYLKNDLKFWLIAAGHQKTVRYAPLDTLYFDPVGEQRHGNLVFVLIIIVAAVVILIFAMINYINLSVAQSSMRAREMATRRLFGSSRLGVVGRMLGESLTVCCVSMLLGLFIAYLVEPLFNDMMQSRLDLASSFTPINVVCVVLFTALIGVVSGLAPAAVVTKFRPIEVVRGTFAYRTKKVYSRILIAFQYAITIVLVGVMVVIYRQTEFIRTTDLGFNTEGIYSIDWSAGRDQSQALRNRLSSMSGVEKVSLCTWIPTDWGNNNTFVYHNIQQSFTVYAGDSTMMDMLGFQILSRTGVVDDKAMWINESGLRSLGLKTAPDEIRYDNGQNAYKIKGVVRDFHFKGMEQQISSALVQQSNVYGVSYVLIKVSDPGVIDRVKPIVRELSGGVPFSGNWLSSVRDRWSATAKRQGMLIMSLSVLALIISALGMLAMASYFIAQRQTEIAVRKVIGATKGEVLSGLMWNFLKLVLVAYCVALPAIWYFGSTWLEAFAYRVPMGWLCYVLPGVVAVAVASLTIFWQAYRAMIVPVATTIKK
ncbi:MAG: FtsX-like permease family protein [Mucinivorans sp.]